MIKRRLYYVPGLISLIFLPIMILFFLKDFKKKNIDYSIELRQYNPRDFDPKYSFADEYFVNYYKIPAKRNYISIDINSLNQKDSSIYKKIELFSKAINIGKDTINGLKIAFNKICYNSFIQTINSCLKSKIKTYYLLGDTMFIYFIPRGMFSDDANENIPSIERILDCGTWQHRGFTFKSQKDYVTSVRKGYFYLLKKYLPIFLTLILLILFSFRWNYLIIKQSIREVKLTSIFLIFVSTIYLFYAFFEALFLI